MTIVGLFILISGNGKAIVGLFNYKLLITNYPL
jgi:hypothetical protein